jgi:hypothetical protein
MSIVKWLTFHKGVKASHFTAPFGRRTCRKKGRKTRGNKWKAGWQSGCRDRRSAWSRTGLREAARRVRAKLAVADLDLNSYEEFEAEAKDMTADSTAAEIEAAGGTALGIEVDVRDQKAVDAMVARVVNEWGRRRCLGRERGRRSWSANGHQGQHP